MVNLFYVQGDFSIKNRIIFIFVLAFSIISIILLNSRFNELPPLGKFFDPFNGYLALNKSDELPDTDVIMAQLHENVEVVWDERRIPHIFAKNEHDLFFVQGYIHAFDRLWQMEFQVMAAGGRLSEIIGEKAIAYDKFQRRIGMMRGAKNVVEQYKDNPTMLSSLEAYTDGINAYISNLKEDQYPIEYKLLDYSPEEWTIRKCALLYMYMAWELSGSTNDMAHTKFLKEYGIDDYRQLYNFDTPILTPIIPKETDIDFKPVKVNKPEEQYISDYSYNDLSIQPNKNNGSNNFALSGSRTESGMPILANDPHLNLTLPSIWYENHLIAPGINSYGVSLLGAPCVVIGFNEKIAWGSTNGMNDVMDFYDIKFRSSDKLEYWHDDQWKKTEMSLERIYVRGKNAVVDTTFMTHHGAVMTHDIFTKLPRFGSAVAVGRAMRWLATEPSMEPMTFYLLNKAENYDDYLEAISYFSCPGQNIIFASNTNDISIWQTNKLVPKWDLQGRFIMDGTDPEHDWKEPLPFNHRPHSKNPDRGFLSSANQNPVDVSFPYFIAGDYAPPFRGARIDQILSTIKHGTYEDLRKIQIDNKSLFAERVVPVMLEQLDFDRMSDAQKALVDALKEWDYFYNPESRMPTLFDAWAKRVSYMTWHDDLGDADEDVEWPNYRILSDLIVDNPDSKWFNDNSTPEVETAKEIIVRAFNMESKKLISQLGELGTDWEWRNSRGTDIYHLAKVPGFGNMNLDTGGDWNIPNATAKTHGPSWRYVVQLGEYPVAYGVYPGGQSGYPGSRHYDEFIDSWVKGQLYKLHFTADIDSLQGHRISFIKGDGK